MNTKTKTVAVVFDYEGRADWIPFAEWRAMAQQKRVYAVKFADGSIWDAVEGWRQEREREREKPIDGAGSHMAPDVRVTDLLEHNNELLERARNAEHRATAAEAALLSLAKIAGGIAAIRMREE